MHNDARMNVALALTAVSHGAVIANHVEVKNLVKNEKSEICGAVVRDVLTGDEWTVQAKVCGGVVGRMMRMPQSQI